MAFKKKKKADPVYAFLENSPAVSVRDREGALNYLVSFVNLLRPKPSDSTEQTDHNFSTVIRLLYQFPASLNALRTAMIAQLVNSNLVPMFTESGITVSRGVGRELYARLKHKFLPALQDHNDFLYLLDRIFYKKADYVWVESIPRERWIQFFELIKLPLSSNEPAIINQAMVSLQILGAGVAQLGWEKEIITNTNVKWMQAENPFETQQFLIYELRELLINEAPVDQIKTLSVRIRDVLKEARELVDGIRSSTNEKGTSLSQTFILFQIEQKLTRMELLLDIVDGDEHINITRFVDLFHSVVRYENRKNSLREFLSQTTGYVAYQIAEHKGKKGGKYITSSPKEYWAMMVSAMFGGLIIVFVAIFKTLLHHLPLAPFWQGFVYSVNYSVGFIAIEETKSTLATKQPAFTASAVAGSLDTKKDEKPNLYNLAVTVSKVFRSQTASFIGNLIIVFPVTFIMAWLFDICFGHPLVGREEGIKMLIDQHPLQSLSLLYACNTGVFLFISGIIAGYVQNKMNYGKIERRLVEHPVLRLYFAPKRLQRIASYLNHHAGSLVGNISLGFFLGTAAIIGNIFGVPFDIRHITISAANTSLGFYGVGWESINGKFLLTVFIGVLFIGFLNFLVSFSLAFIVAVRSRGIHLRDYPEFLQILWKYFRTHPLDFFRPRKRITNN
ncbi:site-specific recombinase [Pseudoflavitalea rhizosphaerae]|uniref:site-specific recombinase n=1 Tax=Pseudoflavitalea rhizosphaerae TaxID=1884793 RepID=UPI000F8E74FA|nr:site-specific recombinase [Pseudoflavitalea rhizosphaerae]